MAYEVLARKYRSQTFDDLIGQDHIARTLKKAIETQRIAHAYLFTGTRGTGKTSTARILAKCLNCLSSDKPTTKPCNKCDSCRGIARGDDIDVIEIDAASNTQVEKTREIIDNAQYRPARSRFKVYIIDEVHMLSKGSFNALLKTLEEPPEHVKFILATTETEKVLPTIQSRCQRYDFRNIPAREITDHLKSVCKQEGIKADDDALMMVAKAGAGSMRDSLSLLDRLLSAADKQLTSEMIEQMLGLPKGEALSALVQAIGEGRVKDVLVTADRMINEGLTADGLVAAMTDHFRNLLILKTCGNDSTLVEATEGSLKELAQQAERFDAVVLTQNITILEELRRQMRQAQAGRALLDATLVRMALSEQFTSIADLLGSVDGGSAAPAAQKKKYEPVAPASLPEPVPAPSAELQIPTRTEREQPLVITPIVRDVVDELEPPPPIRMPGASSSTLSPVEPAPVVSDEDDDLPRPGKVWDNSGPSLAELLRQQSGGASPPRAAPQEEPNVVPVDNDDLPRLWSALLALLQRDAPPMYVTIQMARLVGIRDENAIIRFSEQGATFASLWSKNGKREAISRILTSIRQKPTGVIFESDEVPAAPTKAEPAPAARTPSNGAPRQTTAQRISAVAASAPAAEPTASSQPTTGRLTPEQMMELEKDPLIKALMTEMGAVMLKLTDD